MPTITVQQSGEDKSFDCPSDSTIYDAADKAGIELPASCISGSCGACEATIVSGEVNMEHHSALTDEEIANGLILTCQATCKTDEVTIKYAD